MIEQMKKKKYRIAGILVVLALVAAGTVFYMVHSGSPAGKGQSGEKKEEMYRSLDDADQKTADLYAELYETSREDVAEIRKKTADWEQTGKELEKQFFTIPENTKYRMIQEGYSPEDLEKAEELSAKTGRKAMELAEAKGKASDGRSWGDVVKDSEILTTEEQLGLTEEQIQKLRDRSLSDEERVDVALLLLNGTYTFEEVVRELDAGKTLKDLKKQDSDS